MGNNSIGKHFVVTSFGESHGKSVGFVIDGCPPGLKLDLEWIDKQLQRRRPGQSKITTQRNESDNFEIISGIYEGITTGAPICILIPNKNQKKGDYESLKQVYRPSHADYTYAQKYGHRDPFGGGRASARITAGWVAAGAIAQQWLKEKFGVKLTAFVESIHTVTMPETDLVPTETQIEDSVVRCPHNDSSKQMVERINKAKDEGDSLGGTIRCIIENCPVGIREPVFNKLQAQLGHAMLNINAVKGFEFGSGFGSTSQTGQEHNDEWDIIDGQPQTTTNHSGGIQGGIANGMPITFMVAFKPTSSISIEQNTLDTDLKKVVLAIDGRHDPCVVPRAVPIVEAMAALVIADNLVINS